MIGARLWRRRITMQNLASVRRPSGFQEKSGCRRMRLTVPAFFEGCLVGGSVANPCLTKWRPCRVVPNKGECC